MNQELYQKIENLIDPYYKKTFKELKSIKSFNIEDDIVDIVVALGNKVKDIQQIKLDIARIVKIEYKYPGLKIDFLDAYIQAEEKIIYIGVASGKGGVGKSNVCANLALAFARLNIGVGIIDADVYGPSIPFIFDLKPLPLSTTDDDKIIPAVKHKVQIVSTEFFMPENKPLLWRGPMLNQLLTHYFKEVSWDENTKIILIDLPPGTGDVALDVQEYIPQANMLIVTTPSLSAAHVALKAGLAAKEMGHKMLGIIENMSYFYAQDVDKYYHIFGKEGGAYVSEQLGVELIARIPLANASNLLFEKEEMNGKLYLMLAQKLLEDLGVK